MDNWCLVSDTNEDVTWGFMKYFSDRRNKLNLSVRELGKLADVSYTVIYDFEQRNVLPKMETLIKMAKALKLYVDIKKREEGLLLTFTPNEDFINRVPCRPTRNPRIPVDEQLSKLLSQKGLETKEIEEIKDFIAYKLSKHKK